MGVQCWPLSSGRSDDLTVRLVCLKNQLALLGFAMTNESADEPSYGPLDRAKLARLTTDIVVAYVSKNAIAAADLSETIGIVSECLKSLGQPEETPPSKPKPAVPVRHSITPNEITCLICGKSQKILKRHLAVAHNLTPDAYRERFGLKPDYPIAAPSFTQQRSELAKRIGFGRKGGPHPATQ